MRASHLLLNDNHRSFSRIPEKAAVNKPRRLRATSSWRNRWFKTRWIGQELLAAMVAAKVKGSSIALDVESDGFIHIHSADGISGNGLGTLGHAIPSNEICEVANTS
jgi:hypothetical protein